ncbi:MAG: hypothetical protein ACLVJO_13985 [[Clostridium] scindens]
MKRTGKDGNCSHQDGLGYAFGGDDLFVTNTRRLKRIERKWPMPS